MTTYTARTIGYRRLAMFAAAALWYGVFALIGCQIVPKESSASETKSVAAQTTADVAERTFTEPAPMTLKVPTEEGPVEFSIPPVENRQRAAATRADETIDTTWAWAESIPLGVKLALLAFGLGALWYILKQSRAFRALSTTADEYVTRMVNRAKSRAMAETDPAVSSKFNALAAELGDDLAEWNKP